MAHETKRFFKIRGNRIGNGPFNTKSGRRLIDIRSKRAVCKSAAELVVQNQGT